MRVDVQKVADSAAFPSQVDVVVIGAGIVGTCTAYEISVRECPSPFSKRTSSPASNQVATGDGSASKTATSMNRLLQCTVDGAGRN